MNVVSLFFFKNHHQYSCCFVKILIDYGKGWAEAWNSHVEAWMSESTHVTSRVSSTLLNRLNEPIPLGEYSSSSLDSVPDSLFTGCFYEDDAEWRPKDDSFISNWTNLEDDEILAIFGDDGSRFIHRDDFTGFWPCLVLKRDPEDDIDSAGEKYIVRIFHPSKASVSTWWQDNGVPRFLTKFPRDSIRYFHKPYQSDLFLRGAFRHFIEIPDEMFPELWRDKLLDSSSDDDDARNYDSTKGNIHIPCKFRPGDIVEVKVDPMPDWFSGKVNSWCDDANYYSISADDEKYNNVTRLVKLSNIRWSRNRRLSSSSWHPFF